MTALRVACTLAVLATPRAAAQQTSYELQRVADGVYTIFRTTDPYTPADGNATVIVNERDVVVVDANLAPSSAREMIAEIRKLTPNPVRYVINTHWHDDHVLGNQAYLEAFPGVEFIAHPRTRTAVLGQVAPSLVKNAVEYPKTFAQIEKRLAEGKKADGSPMTGEDRARTRRQIAGYRLFMDQMPGIRVTPPSLTAAGDLVLYRGDREIHIRHLGRGNTAGDLVVHLPRERVLITGDLVVAPVPYSFGSFIGEWIRTLGVLRAIDADVIVPGHGPLQHDRQYIDGVIALLEELRRQTTDAVRRGLTLEQTREEVKLDEFRRRFAGDSHERDVAFRLFFLTPAVERAWLDARGET